METKLKQLLKTIKLNESMLSMLFGIVTVLLIGVLVFRMYSANKPNNLMSDADKTELPQEKVGTVAVTTKDDGKQYPATLADKVKVAKGENLWQIAEKNYGSGYNWVDIAKENKLKNANILTEGQELTLPKVAVKTLETKKVAVVKAEPLTISGDSYKVVKGDSLWTISVRAYGDGYKWSDVAKANNLKRPGHLEVGQELKLPR